jgi:hypothetical protein
MRRVRAELRGPISALVLLGIIARLLLPLPAFAAAERAAFDSLLRSALCLPSGQSGPVEDEQSPHAAPAGHCPLCRLPEGAWSTPPADVVLNEHAWLALEQARPPVGQRRLVPPFRGPPPARAPPTPPTIG